MSACNFCIFYLIISNEACIVPFIIDDVSLCFLINYLRMCYYQSVTSLIMSLPDCVQT